MTVRGNFWLTFSCLWWPRTGYRRFIFGYIFKQSLQWFTIWRVLPGKVVCRAQKQGLSYIMFSFCKHFTFTVNTVVKARFSNRVFSQTICIKVQVKSTGLSIWGLDCWLGQLFYFFIFFYIQCVVMFWRTALKHHMFLLQFFYVTLDLNYSDSQDEFEPCINYKNDREGHWVSAWGEGEKPLFESYYQFVSWHCAMRQTWSDGERWLSFVFRTGFADGLLAYSCLKMPRMKSITVPGFLFKNKTVGVTFSTPQKNQTQVFTWLAKLHIMERAFLSKCK